MRIVSPIRALLLHSHVPVLVRSTTSGLQEGKAAEELVQRKQKDI